MLLEFDVVGRDEVDSVARIPVLVAHERRGTVLMGWIQFTESLKFTYVVSTLISHKDLQYRLKRRYAVS